MLILQFFLWNFQKRKYFLHQKNIFVLFKKKKYMKNYDKSTTVINFENYICFLLNDIVPL